MSNLAKSFLASALARVALESADEDAKKVDGVDAEDKKKKDESTDAKGEETASAGDAASKTDDAKDAPKEGDDLNLDAHLSDAGATDDASTADAPQGDNAADKPAAEEPAADAAASDAAPAEGGDAPASADEPLEFTEPETEEVVVDNTTVEETVDEAKPADAGATDAAPAEGDDNLELDASVDAVDATDEVPTPAEGEALTVDETATDEAPAVADETSSPDALDPETLAAAGVEPVDPGATDSDSSVSEPVDEEAEDDAAFSEDPHATELMDALAEAHDAHEAASELALVNDGLVENRDTLESLNEMGGVSAESLPFFEAALKVYTDGVGREPIMLGVSQESFEGEEPGFRQQVSLEDLNELIVAVGKAVNPLQEQVASAEARVQEVNQSLVKTGIQFESFDGLASAQMDAAAGRGQMRLEDLVSGRAGLEQLCEMIEAQNEAGGLTTDAMVGASLALEAHTRFLKLSEIVLAPSLEGLKLDDRTVVSTEGVIEAIKSVGSAIANSVRTSVRVARNAVGMLRGTLPTVILKLEKFEKTVEAATGETSGTVATGNAAKRLNKNGEMPGDLVGYLSHYGAFIDKMCSQFTGKASSALSFNAGLYEKLDYLSPAGILEDLNKIAEKWEDPRKIFSGEELKTDIPGGGRMFADPKLDHRYTGENEGARKLDAFFNEYMVNGLWVRGKAKVPSVESLKALSVSEIKAGVSMFIKALHAINPDHLEVSSNVIGRLWAAESLAGRKRRKGRQAVRGAKPEVAVLDRALWGSCLLAIDFGWHAAKEFVKIALAFLAYAERSLATIGGSAAQPATESHQETVSMEADIKSLKSGKRVKYSHGHGKIVKVFTAPFKYKGEAHHASKDTPKFEVKSDKGKLSIHKASALTLA